MKILKKIKSRTLSLLRRFFITIQLYIENGLANHAAACAYGFLLSLAPMLLLLAFFIFFAFRSSPGAITALIGTIPFLGSIFDEKWLYSDLFSFANPGIPGIISAVSIIWACRILALAIQRGLRAVFPSEKKRNNMKNTMLILAIGTSVLILMIIVIISSRTALRFYNSLGFLPEISIIRLIATNTGVKVISIFLIGIASFFVYLFVPEKPPRKFSAFLGALSCTLAYLCMVMILGVILNIARYNFLYGTFGNLIIILINVYFFFTFFYFGAQMAFVIDSFDALLFSRLRKMRLHAARKNKSAGYFKKLRPSSLLAKLFNPSESNLNIHLRTFKKGELIFSQVNKMDDILYILEGEVEVLITSFKNNNEFFAGVLKPDSFLGEISKMLSEDMAAEIRAKTDVSVFMIPPVLLDAISDDAGIDSSLVDHISKKFKDLDKTTVETAISPV